MSINREHWHPFVHKLMWATFCTFLEQNAEEKERKKREGKD